MAVGTIQGTLASALQYHYDVEGDVLYVRLSSAAGEETYGEEDEHGFHVLHSLLDDRVVGVTIVGFWRDFGEGTTPLTQVVGWEARLEESVSHFGRQLLAA